MQKSLTPQNFIQAIVELEKERGVERQNKIADIIRGKNEIFEKLFHQIYPNDEEQVKIRAIKSLLISSDLFSKTDTEAVLAALASRISIQKKWAEWTRIDDREELRLRLEILAEIEHIDDSLVDFITFFFRASDPLMFQTAAITLGCHVSYNEALKTYFNGFIQTRNIEEPLIFLNDLRSRRRVLIAQAAAHLKRSDSGDFPLPETPDFLSNCSQTDLGVYLIVLKILYKGKTSPALHALIEHAIQLRPVELEKSVVKHWTALLLTYYDKDPEKRMMHIQVMMDHILNEQYSSPLKLPEVVRLLGKIDELMRQLALWPGAIALDSILTQTDENKALYDFCQIRFALWKYRLLRESSPIDQIPENQILSTIYTAYFEEKKNILGQMGGEEAKEACFSALLRLFMHEEKWAESGVENKALLVFSLLDLSVFQNLHADHLESLLKMANNEYPGLTRENTAKKGWVSLFVVQLLQRRNIAEAEEMLDAEQVHQLGGLHDITALIPAHSESDLLPVLADVIEHQMRLRLAVETDFDVYTFLYRLSASEPHPDFFRLLRDLMNGRHYQNKRGENLDPHGFVDAFLRFYSLSELKNDDIDESIAAFFDVLETKNILVKTWKPELLNLISQSKRLLLSERDPVSRMLQFTELFRVNAEEGEELVSGGFWYWVHRMQSHKVSAIQTHNRIQTPIEESIEQQLPGMRNLVEKLFPTVPDQAYAIEESASELHEKLHFILQKVQPLLGFWEKNVLKQSVHRFLADNDEWARTTARLQREWKLKRDLPAADRQNHFAKWFIQNKQIAYDRQLLRMLWGGLRTARAEQLKSFEDDWHYQFELLKWAINNPFSVSDTEDIYEEWENALHSLFLYLCEKAMEKGYESGLSELTTAKDFQFLQKKHAALREKVCKWFYDRFDLVGASRVTLGQKSNALAFSARYLQNLPSFFAHFAEIWLSLMIGAILMLDFGDAWKAMAEEGDILGILITAAIAVIGTFLYLFRILSVRAKNSPGFPYWLQQASRLRRAVLFMLSCMLYALFMTSMLWLLLSGTDEVVHGLNAILHVIVWAAFALFVGVFFGLIGKST